MHRLVCLLLLTASAVAQPSGAFVDISTGTSGPPLNGTVTVAEAHGDSVLVSGGFGLSGLTELDRLAWWTGEAWAPSPSPGGDVDDAVTAPDGALLVTGSFRTAGEDDYVPVKRWTGTDWAPATASVAAGFVTHLATGPDGAVALRSFLDAGDEAVFLWRDEAWSQFPPTFGFGDDLAFGPDGVLYAAAQDGVYRLDAGSWSRLGGPSDRSVSTLAFGPDGSLYAGGTFDVIGGQPAPGAARWTGTAWQPLGPGLAGWVRGLAFGPDGTLYAVGNDSDSGARAARWTGTVWEPLGDDADASILNLTVSHTGTLTIVGGFRTLGPTAALYAAQWDGAAWQSLGSAVAGPLSPSVVLGSSVGPEGGLVIVGSFVAAGDAAAHHVARRSGGAWEALGDTDSWRATTDVVHTQDGTLYVATERSGAPADVLRWDGAAWQPTGLDLRVSALGRDAGGAPLAVVFDGPIGVYRLDGGVWTALGGEVFDGPPSRLALGPDGSLYAAGFFSTPARGVVRWTGSAWEAVGTDPPVGATGLAVGPDGSVYVAGVEQAGLFRVMEWDGTAWEVLPGLATGLDPTSLAVTPDGTLYLGGNEVGLADDRTGDLARWDGTDWTLLTAPSVFFDFVRTLAVDSDGALYAGGSFPGYSGVSSPNVILYDAAGTTVGAGPNDAVAFAVAPNPASGTVRLRADVPTGAVEVALFDALGRRVRIAFSGESAGRLDMELSLDGLAPGVYVVRIATAEGVASERLVVTR